MTAAADNAIDTVALARRFDAVAAVSDFTAQIRRGELYGLVGPDGAGKSTVIRMLCGILPPTGGTAQILGRQLGIANAAIKARIGYLSQEFTLYGDMSVDENIAFFAELHGVRGYSARRDDLLRGMDLIRFRDRRAAALSGGMKKKLALACTLIHTPELILLDEPSTGVDPVSRGEFWHILSGILAQGVTIVMTTPYLDEAERCHRVSLMHAGQVLLTGTPAEVRAAMPGRMWHIALADAPGAYRALRTAGRDTDCILYGGRLRLWDSATGTRAADLAVWLDGQGLGPAAAGPEEATLEDAFVALMNNPDKRR